MAHTQTALRLVPKPGDAQKLVTSSIVALADITGMSHTELATKAAIEPSKLSKSLSMKRRLPLEEIDRLAVALEVPVVVLYDGGDEIRRRARLAVLAAPAGPTPDPGGLEVAPRGCKGGSVIDLGARRVKPATPSKKAA